MMRTPQAIRSVVVAAGALALVAAGASAQERADPRLPPSIQVTGEATVAARPDQAQIDIGVVAQAPTAQAAAAQNARQADAVLAALRQALGRAAALQTAGYSLTPNYRRPREGEAPTITGYTATNTVQVKTEDLAAVGRLIDTAMQAGANQIQRLQFTLKDEGAAQAQALREAATKARAQAEALAAALGLRIVRVLSVIEGAPVVVRPLARAPMALGGAVSAAPTPVEAGTIDVHAAVTLVVEVAQ